MLLGDQDEKEEQRRMREQAMTWGRIKAAALDGTHPLVNEAERKIMCPRCETWQSEADYRNYAMVPRYFAYLVPIRTCPLCGHIFAVVI